MWHVYGTCWVLPYTDYTGVDSAIDEEWKHDVVGKLKRLPNWAIAQFVALPKNRMDWRKRV